MSKVLEEAGICWEWVYREEVGGWRLVVEFCTVEVDEGGVGGEADPSGRVLTIDFD